MVDVHIAELAARQHNRFTTQQALALGATRGEIEQRLAVGRWVAAHTGVFAIAPVLAGDWGRWWGAVLTTPGSALSHDSAACARGFWDRRPAHEVITRPGSGGPELLDGVRVHRSKLLIEDVTLVDGLPVTTTERTLIDLAPHLSRGALARALREALRTKATTMPKLADALERHRGRRGTRKLRMALERWSGLPIDRVRSGSEVRALERARDANKLMPEVNVLVAGEEADLVWRKHKLIIELDGGPFHQDRGEDARKRAIWEAAGFRVIRLPSGVPFDDLERLLTPMPDAERR